MNEHEEKKSMMYIKKKKKTKVWINIYIYIYIKVAVEQKMTKKVAVEHPALLIFFPPFPSTKYSPKIFFLLFFSFHPS